MDIAPLTLIVGSNGAIRESASVGLGVTLVSRDAVAAELASRPLAEIGVPRTPLHRDWYLVARRETLPPPAARLVDHVLHTGSFRSPDREGFPMTEPVPVTAVAQAGRDRVRVMTGLTTHAGRALPERPGPDLRLRP